MPTYEQLLEQGRKELAAKRQAEEAARLAEAEKLHLKIEAMREAVVNHLIGWGLPEDAVLAATEGMTDWWAPVFNVRISGLAPIMVEVHVRASNDTFGVEVQRMRVAKATGGAWTGDLFDEEEVDDGTTGYARYVWTNNDHNALLPFTPKQLALALATAEEQGAEYRRLCELYGVTPEES